MFAHRTSQYRRAQQYSYMISGANAFVSSMEMVLAKRDMPWWVCESLLALVSLNLHMHTMLFNVGPINKYVCSEQKYGSNVDSAKR